MATFEECDVIFLNSEPLGMSLDHCEGSAVIKHVNRALSYVATHMHHTSGNLLVKALNRAADGSAGQAQRLGVSVVRCQWPAWPPNIFFTYSR